VASDSTFDEKSLTDVANARPAKAEKLRLVVVAGPDRGKEVLLDQGTYTVGKSPQCDLTLTDGAVSRKHLEFAVIAEGVQITDLGSTNGSYVHGSRFDKIVATAGAGITVGQTELRLLPVSTGTRARSQADRFGEMLGQSEKMREVYAVLERVSMSDASVLVIGETGTGKELVADAIHNHSMRKKGPMVICDLASLPKSLIESELFGHVRGAFTGADRDREGAFSQADKGTIFLDEIGEMDLEVQPRLLRALERGHVKPVGTTQYKSVDTRVVAATNRDLVDEVKNGRFREDLYHRLAVVTVHLPPLRQRKEDIPLLVHHFLALAAEGAGRKTPQVRPEAMAALCDHEWPGNVRELRNVMERVVAIAPRADEIDLAVLGLEGATRAAGNAPGAAAAAPAGAAAGAAKDENGELLQFKDAKEHLIAGWERDYLRRLIEQCNGNVSLAARRAGIDRVYLHRLMKKHGLG
jgi:two-component system, NtrC family, nitrogen regulation response regulator GlnG